MLEDAPSGVGASIDDLAAAASLAAVSSSAPRIDVCDCAPGGVKMQLYASESKMVCPRCSRAVPVRGTVVDDQQQDGGTVRSSGGRVHKTFTQYWEPIIRAERWDVTQAQAAVDQLVGHLNHNGFTSPAARKTLTCDLMYKYIKELGMIDKLGKHIPKLMVHFGVPPAHVPDAQETTIVFDRYIAVLGVYDRIKDNLSQIVAGGKQRANNITRPYYIYKIIEATFARGHPMRSILHFIPLQQRETVVSNDLIWQKICAELHFVYFPTDRNNI